MSNINYKFMNDGITYAGTTKKSTPKEANRVIRELKFRVDQLNNDYDKKELSEIYTQLKRRLNTRGYKKVPVDTIEIKFFSANEVTGETIDKCHGIFAEEWYLSHNPTAKIKAKYENHIEDFVFYCETEGVNHIMFIDEKLILKYLSYYRENGNFTTTRSGKKVSGRRVNTIKSAPATNTYNDRVKTIKYLMRVLKKTYSVLPDCSGIEYMKSDNSDGNKKGDFSDSELEQIKNYIERTDKHFDVAPVILFRVGLATGLRLADIVYLRKENVQYNKANKRHYIIKMLDKTRHIDNKGKVTIPVSRAFYEFLEPRLKSDSDFLFPELLRYYTKEGDSIKNNLSSRFKTFLERCGIETQATSKQRGHKICIKGVHSLRHTFARLLSSQKGIDIDDIRKVMGHGGVQMTMLYTRRLTNDQALQISETMDGMDLF